MHDSTVPLPPRRPLFPVLAIAALVVLPGCARDRKPDRPVGAMDRSTATHAYEWLKAAVAAKQVDLEWRALSPGFKRRLSEQAGRTVDIGDYAHARATFASNSTKEIAMLLSSEVVSERSISPDLAILSVQAGNQRATPRFVRMRTWEIRLRGEGQPVSEFVSAEENVVRIAPDGSIQLRVVPTSGTAAFLKGIPSDRIEEMHVLSEWYLDDFGGVESAVAGALKGGPAPQKPLAPPPRPPTKAPPATGGFGSPDGATLR